MQFFRRSLTGLFLLALTLGLLAVAGQTIRTALEAKLAGRTPGQPAPERVFAANIITAEATDIAPVLTAFGEIRSRRTLELRAPSAGTVIALADEFEDGAAVRAGQLLLQLDPADAMTARDLALSDMARAEAEQRDADRALVLARDEVGAAQAQADLRAQALARQRDLEQRKVGSISAVETAALAASAADQAVLSRRSALAQAEARLDQAKTALSRQAITVAEAERALDDTELFAAFDGVLSDVSTVSGRILGSNERIGDLIDPNALEVSFRISTAQFARLIDANGQLIPAQISVVLEVSGADLVATGTLSRVGAAVEAGQTGRLLYATLSDAPGFRPGDFVNARVAEPPLRGVIVLPATAYGADGTVLALAQDDRLETLPAQLLRRQGDAVILAAQGLVGRDLVQERSPLLGTGIKVKPIRTEAGAVQQATAPERMTLTAERRAALIAFVEGNDRMPPDAKARILAQLAQDEVPAAVIERLESRMGG